jgi:pyrroline-5-carboxylate reductase
MELWIIYFTFVKSHLVGHMQVLGSAKMVLETNKHPGQLKDEVASPGGTTIAGIHELEKMGFRAALMNAVLAATERGEKFSK